MYYLDLRVPIFSLSRKGEVDLSKKTADTLLRDIVAENIYNLISLEKNDNKDPRKQGKFVPRSFNSIEEHRSMAKIKDELLYSEAEVLELGNNKFEFIKKNFSVEGHEATLSHLLVVLSDLLEETTKRSDDEKAAEKWWKENKDRKPITVKDFYKERGVKVVYKEEKPEEAK